MKKVLITGIDSFTGIHLSKYFNSNNFDVYGTSLFKDEEKIFKCDITNKNEIKKIIENIKPDFLIHLSAISFVGHKNSLDFYNVNTIGTTNILDSFVELLLNPKKIILVSSATIYGNQNKEILDENLCANPTNHYGLSKYAMECLAKNYFTLLPIIITRPFNYTGIGQSKDFLIPKIVSHFKENKKVIELGNVDIIREFNDINFVCEVYEKLLESDFKSEIVNIASNRGIKLLEIINMMNKIAGYEIEVKINPAFVRKNEIKKLTGSSEKLFKMIKKIEQKNFEKTLLDIYKS
jgi:nucleoside-diphosphate-sugar epimerase